MRLWRVFAGFVLLLLPTGRADVRNCACDPARPETMEARECSLCRTAETQPAGPMVFFVHDANPNKPNRWLAVPKLSHHGAQELSGMTPEQRSAYWTAAIAKAQELWGDQWGLAVNSPERRTQCHMHIHIGKLLDGAENDRFTLVAGPAEIPLPLPSDGLLVHPAGGKLHVHTGDAAPELLLQR
jgi:diadenosine tetraphosphate (Ap4A) HIT family hydrolase